LGKQKAEIDQFKTESRKQKADPNQKLNAETFLSFQLCPKVPLSHYISAFSFQHFSFFV